MALYALNSTCRGESHKASDKPCQDCSWSWCEGDRAIAVVSDGHGSDRYFRSATGARLAVEITAQALRTLIDDERSCEILKNTPFTAVKALKHWGAESGADERDLGNAGSVDEYFRHLFAHILYKWRESIENDARTVPLTPWEKEHVEQQYLDELASDGPKEKIYGCTLIAFARTASWWLAFQIGDGKCLSFSLDALGNEPIPWDDDCFLNHTTSLCDDEPLKRFRYCCQGDGGFPAAIFLGSDGLDDTYPDEYLENYYITLSKYALNGGADALKRHLDETLAGISATGSKDDMSVACVYDGNALGALLPSLEDRQAGLRAKWEKEKQERLQEQIDNLRERNGRLSQDLKTVGEQKKTLQAELDARRRELDQMKDNLLQLQGSLEKSQRAFQELNVKIATITSQLERYCKDLRGVGDDSEKEIGIIRQWMSKISLWLKARF